MVPSDNNPDAIDGPFVLGCTVMVDAVKPLNPPVLDHAIPT